MPSLKCFWKKKVGGGGGRTRSRFRAGAWRNRFCLFSCFSQLGFTWLRALSALAGHDYVVYLFMGAIGASLLNVTFFWFCSGWRFCYGFGIFLAAPLDCSCESNPGSLVSKYSQSGWLWSWLLFLVLTTHVLRALGFLLSFPLVAAPVKHRFGSVRKMSDAITRNWGDFEKMFQKNSPLFFRYL